jgi:hypothetical protein
MSVVMTLVQQMVLVTVAANFSMLRVNVDAALQLHSNVRFVPKEICSQMLRISSFQIPSS